MRVLVTAISDADWLCRPLAAQPGLEIAAYHPTYVDTGDWGVSRTDPSQPRPYTVRAARVFPTRPYTASLYLGGLAPLLREFRPDVLYHFGEPSELGSWQVIRLVRRFSPETRVVLFSLENVIQRWHGIGRRLRGMAMDATVPRLDMIVCASQSVADAWEQLGVDPARLRVVYLPVDTEKFYPREAADLRAQWGTPGDFVAGYIGRFVPEKAVDVLLRAMALLPDNCILALEGAGPCEAELRALWAELRLGDRVRWLGRIPSAEVPRYMSAYDALVLPSRSIPVWQEQFGRVLPEAMLCGTPVVGSSCGAIPDVIGEAGLVFAENDPGGLAECLLKLRDHPDLRRDLAERGLKRAHEQFTMDVMVERLVGVLKEATELPR